LTLLAQAEVEQSKRGIVMGAQIKRSCFAQMGPSEMQLATIASHPPTQMGLDWSVLKLVTF